MISKNMPYEYTNIKLNKNYTNALDYLTVFLTEPLVTPTEHFGSGERRLRNTTSILF